MKKMRQFLGWAIAGLIVIAAVLVFMGKALPMVVMIANRSSDISDLSDTLQSKAKRNPKPTAPEISEYDVIRTRLIKKYDSVVAFYDAHDKPLEQWHKRLDIKSARFPTASEFRVMYLNEMDALNKQFEDNAAITLGYHRPMDDEDEFVVLRGFNWEDWDNITVKELTNEYMRLLQKRFWIRKWLAEIAQDPKLSISRLLEVDFLVRIKNIDLELVHSEEQGIQMTRWERAFIPRMGRGSQRQTTIAEELLLPGNLGETITFGVAVMLPYEKIPDLIDRIQRVTENAFLVHMVGCRIYVHDQNPHVYPETVAEDKAAEREAELKELYGSRHPIVAITAYVIDFDASKKKKF